LPTTALHGAKAHLLLDSQALRIWRATLLFLAGAESCMQAGAAYWQGSFGPQALPGPYGAIASSGPATLVVAGTTVVALWYFLGPRASLVAGYLAIAGMKTAGETFERVFASHHQDFYQGGAMVLGVVIGETYARMIGIVSERSRSEALEARRFGMTGALAMLAGTYMAAGSSKLLAGGIGWATSSTVRLMILSHSEVEWNLAEIIPAWTANHPYVCMALEVGTLIVQLGAFMLIVGPRARTLWASLLAAFHMGIYLSSHILFVSALVFSAVVAIPWAWVLRRPPAADELDEVTQDTARPALRQRALLLFVIALVGVWGLLSLP
jgi:hypothetical protein